MKRNPFTLYFKAFFLVFISFLLINQCGCSRNPESIKSPSSDVPSPSPTLSYQSFLDEGIDKCLNGQYKEAISPLLKAKEISPREGIIHYWLFQAYKNTETQTFRESKTYIEGQNVIALMPDSPQAKQVQEYVNGKAEEEKQIQQQANKQLLPNQSGATFYRFKSGKGEYMMNEKAAKGDGWKEGIKAAIDRGTAKEEALPASAPSIPGVSGGFVRTLGPPQSQNMENNVDTFITNTVHKDAESLGVKYKK